MAKKQTARGRKQDRARVAGGQDYEVRYEGKKTRKSSASRQEGREKGRQQPQAGRAKARGRWRKSGGRAQGAPALAIERLRAAA